MVGRWKPLEILCWSIAFWKFLLCFGEAKFYLNSNYKKNETRLFIFVSTYNLQVCVH